MGYSRASSQLLTRASRTCTFTGSAGAGSTCSPSLSLLCNRRRWAPCYIVIVTFPERADSARRALRLVISAISNHRPGNAGGLVGHRHRRHIGMTTRYQTHDPLAQSVVLAIMRIDRGATLMTAPSVSLCHGRLPPANRIRGRRPRPWKRNSHICNSRPCPSCLTYTRSENSLSVAIFQVPGSVSRLR